MLGNIPRTTSKPVTTLLRVLPEVKISDLAELVNQAYETGAIAYWAASEVLPKRNVDGVYEFQLSEQESGEVYTVDVNVIKKGIEDILNRKVEVNTYIYSYIWSGVQTGVYDADACDCIVQAGLFGDIVYG